MDGPAYPEGPLLDALTQVHSILLDASGVEGFLTAVALLVATLTQPRVACAISLPESGRRTGVGTSGRRASRLRELELAHGDGPTLEALHSDALVYVEDLAVDTRWRGCRGPLLEHGVTSLLSVPHQVDGRAVFLTTLYVPGSHQLDRREVRDILVLGDAAARALVVLQKVEQLRRAAASRPVIDQALGIVMAARGCTASEAFDVLRIDSQTSNLPVRRIAAKLVVATTGRDPEPAKPFIERRSPGPGSSTSTTGV